MGDGMLDLTGRGAVTVTLLSRGASNHEPSRIDITSTTFRFAPAADPVPEPATMLLIGSGLAGIAASRRRFKGG